MTASVTAVLGLLAASACDTAGTPVIHQIRIATGSPGAVYHRYATAYAAALHRLLPKTRVIVLSTAASAENVTMVEEGTAEVGFTQADVVTTRTPGSVSALARLYDDCLHLVVRKDAPIHSVSDLRGRRVSLGEDGSGTEVTARRLFQVTAVDPGKPVGLGDLATEQMSLTTATTALAAGRIDAFFFSGGPPVDLIGRLASETPIRLVNLAAYVSPMRLTFGYHYVERLVPTTTYGIAPAVSIGIPNYFIVSSSMSATTAHALTKALFSAQSDLGSAHPVGAGLNARDAISTPPLSLHPGAVRYYRSVKV